MDIRTALKNAIGQLREASVPSHTLAAELLLMHILQCDRAWLYGHPEETLAEDASSRFLEMVARRSAGTPTQYLTGKQEFWGLEFEVGPGVFIPRPETEHVVEVALARLGPQHASIKPKREQATAPLRIADVGTGSGCLAVALARELPAARVWATDISLAALEFARRNAGRHGILNRMEFIEANLLTPFLPGGPVSCAAPFDLIVTNPPYVGFNEAAQLPREVREHEPPQALFTDTVGYMIYTELLAQSAQLLVRGGIMVMELGHDAAKHALALVGSGWTRVDVTNDLAGIPRVLTAERAK
jgi:release factor glutamine methyltransferase